MALDKFDAAMRLVKAVTGDPYGDGCRVTDIGKGIVEPGYGDADTLWVLGNWNDVTDYSTGERVVTDNRMSRLFDALERIGVEGHWLDEWVRCDGCQSLMRNQPDSYHWQPSYAYVGDNRYCRDCATGEYLDDTVAEYIWDSNKCLTASLISEGELTDTGWIRFNDPAYESGWHPGQTDNPADIAARFAESHPGTEWLFYLDESSQFYVRFSLFYREPEDRCEVCGDYLSNCPEYRDA